MKRVFLDQKVNVQSHDFFLFKSYKLFGQNGLLLVLVLCLGGAKAKFLRLSLPTPAKFQIQGHTYIGIGTQTSFFLSIVTSIKGWVNSPPPFPDNNFSHLNIISPFNRNNIYKQSICGKESNT